MRRIFIIFALGTLGLGSALTGCAASRTSSSAFTVQHVVDREVDPLFDTAKATLVELGCAIDRVDRDGGLITTRPVFIDEEGAAIDDASKVRSPKRRRRVTTVRVHRAPQGVRVQCRVAIQAMTTAALTMAPRDQRVVDYAGATAIDRDAANTRAQSTDWQTVRRDRAAERTILAAILAE